MKVTSLRYLDAKFHHPSPKIKKNPKNTNGRLAIPALAGLLVTIPFMHSVYCPGDVHWARLEASALGSLCCLPCMEEKRDIVDLTLIFTANIIHANFWIWLYECLFMRDHSVYPRAKSCAWIYMTLLTKIGLGPVSRWVHFGGDLGWPSLSFRGHSRSARFVCLLYKVTNKCRRVTHQWILFMTQTDGVTPKTNCPKHFDPPLRDP